MSSQDFVDGLTALGYEPRDLQLEPRVIAFCYTILVGSRAGESIDLALAVPGDFPLQSPSGPHVRPHLLPFNGTSDPHPVGGVHAARDGVPAEWQYWSRPYPEWATSDRSARAYMGHIHHLFEAL